MSGWSGGSVSFSGGPNTYDVTYNAPTYTFPSNASSVTSGSNGGGSPVSCGSSVSKTFWVRYFWATVGEWIDSETTISGTAPACPPPEYYPPVWTDNTLAPFVATVAYSDSVSATNMSYFGSAYSVSAGTLPTGISFSAGALTGTPTVAGQSYSFTIAASNPYNTITQSFTGTVAAAPTAGKIRVYNGSAWVYGPVKVFNGSVWVEGQAHVYNGSAWVKSV